MAPSSAEAIPEYFDTEFFKSALQSGLRVADIEIVSFVIEKPLYGGENYCSNIYRAMLKYKIDDNNEEIFVIIKSLPEKKQGVLKALNIYSKETIFYLDIKPKLEAVMWYSKTTWELGAKHIFSTAHPEQTIILHDLARHGFSLRSRQEGLDEVSAMAVLEKLAQYHALSMIMAERDHHTIVDKFQYGILNRSSINTPAFKALFGAQLLKLAEIVAEWPEFEDIAKKLLYYHEKFAEMITKSVYPMKGAVNVLNHGDLWINNILFRDNAEGLPSDVRFIDFQLCFYGSLGFDLNYFFNTSLQLDVLQNRKEALLQVYFQHLKGTLEALPGSIIPPTLDLVKEEVKEREGYGFFVAFGFLPLMAMGSMDSQDNSLENFHDDEFAAKKIEKMFQKNGRTLETLKHILKNLTIFE